MHTVKKQRKNFLSLSLCMLLLPSIYFPNVWAAELAQVTPVGKAIGIAMAADGVMIVNLIGVQTAEGEKFPARDVGLQQGDIIQSANDKEIQSNDDLQKIVTQSAGNAVTLSILREGKPMQVSIQPMADTSGHWRMGVMVRDSITGIGTLTFVNPQTREFASLGHAICDADTGTLLPLAGGTVMEASITNVVKGTCGQPGELQGDFNLQESAGTLTKNAVNGIYGMLADERFYRALQTVPLVTMDEAQVGDAQIVCNVSGEKTQAYTIKIERIFDDSADSERGMMIQITDPALLSQTGGIVQGMSGSPILQNGKLIGAVTHVLVNDPTRGYAIFAEKMLGEFVKR